MNRRWYLFFLLMSSAFLFNLCEKPQPTVQKWHTDYSQLIQEAQKNQKPIVLKFYTDWCVWCKKLDSVTLQDSAVKEYLTGFNLGSFNAEKDTALAHRYGIIAFPTVVICNYQGQEIDRIHYEEPANFIQVIQGYFDNKGTLDAMLTAEKERPDSAQLLFDIADKYTYRNQRDVAQTYYEKIIQIDSANQLKLKEQSVFQIAYIYRKNKEYDTAIAYFQKFMEQFPQSEQASDAYYYIGSLTADKGDSVQALVLLKDWLKRYPDSPDTVYIRDKIAKLSQGE